MHICVQNVKLLHMNITYNNLTSKIIFPSPYVLEIFRFLYFLFIRYKLKFYKLQFSFCAVEAKKLLI